MHVFLLLCDAAQRDSSTGKMHLLGADWSVTGEQVRSMGVAVFFRASWDEVEAEGEETKAFSLQLLDDQSRPVSPPNPDAAPLRVEGQFRLDELAKVTDDDIARLVDIHGSFTATAQIQPGMLEAGNRYVWSFAINGTEAASVAFAVRPT